MRVVRICATVFTVLALAVATVVLLRDPLRLPGSHQVTVYAVNDSLSGETDHPPGLFGRVTGRCDAGSYYYARDAGHNLCLALDGPLGHVRARRHRGRVTLPGGEVAALSGMARKNAHTTMLCLMSGRPAALIPVTDLAGDRDITVSALG